MEVRHEITVVDSEDTEVRLVFDEERLRALHQELGDLLKKYAKPNKATPYIPDRMPWPWKSLEDK